MKTFKLICAFLLTTYTIQAQTISCSDFTITNIYADSIHVGDYQISIFFDANPFEITNYPLVSTLVDCNGDTVATGNLFWFGQLGQTTQDYPVTLTGNGSINCYPLTASFVINYDPNQTDTCQLSFGASGLNSITHSNHPPFIHPNPSNANFILINCSPFVGQHYSIYDSTGKRLALGIISDEQTAIETNFLTDGIYFLRVGEGWQHSLKLVIRH
jgi:Secretion system C-terminal sorting domain